MKKVEFKYDFCQYSKSEVAEVEDYIYDWLFENNYVSEAKEEPNKVSANTDAKVQKQPKSKSADQPQ